MSRLRVLLDIDGVAANFIDLYLGILNDMMGTMHHHDDVHTWSIHESLGLPADVEKEVCRRISETEGACLSIKPYPGAAEGVAKLMSFADVYAVTAPMPGRYWIPERYQWLKEQLGIPWGNVLFGSAKYVCAGDVLVEDKTENLRKWCASHGGHGILWRAKTNRRDPWGGIEVSSWEELCDVVGGLADGYDHWGMRRWTTPSKDPADWPTE